jgi:hypothetical protein
MAPNVIAFSDDGRGVQRDEQMALAMRRAKALGKMIVAHCEVNDLLRGVPQKNCVILGKLLGRGRTGGRCMLLPETETPAGRFQRASGKNPDGKYNCCGQGGRGNE